MSLPAGARASDAQIALFPLYAEDTFARALQGGSGAAMLAPAPDPRLGAAWNVRGTLVSQDPVSAWLFSEDPTTCFYGWLLERAVAPGEFMAVIRGTGDAREWWLDADCELIPHQVVGRVERGFSLIARAMRYRPIGGGDFPAADGIAAEVGAGHLLITGHSLGSALGTLLSFDVAAPGLLGSRVEAVLFASPRPGDSAFGAAFNLRVPAHRVYFWEADVVPDVPRGFGYAPVPGNIALTPPLSVQICRSPTCAHHCLSYASMLDPAVLESFEATSLDQPFLRCLSDSATI